MTWKFAIDRYKEIEMSSGIAFRCRILRGTPIGFAENEGRGGATMTSFTNLADGREFGAYAAEIYPEAIEPVEDLITKLLWVRELSAKRCVIFLLDDETGWETVRQFPREWSRDRALAHLRDKLGDRRPRIWDRASGMFVDALATASSSAGTD